MQQQTKMSLAGRALASGLAMTFLIGSVPVVAQTGGKITLEAGTVIPVTFDSQLTSNKSQKGDRFTAKVKMDGKSYIGLPQGTVVEGVVTEAKAKKDKEPGVLDLDFKKIRLPDGRAYNITSGMINLDNKSVETDENGRIIAKEGHKRDDTKYIGYGAAAGALFSLLGNKGRISIENLILGSAAGYAAGALIKGPKEARDVVLKPGTEVGVRLDKSVRVDRVNYNDIPDDDRAPLTPDPDSNARSSDDFAVLVGDNDVAFNPKAKPFQSGSTWMLPVKAVLDAASVRFRYTGSSRKLEVTEGDAPFRVTVGSQIAVMSNGARRRMGATVREVNGTLFAPVKFFELATGMRANYDQSSNTLSFERSNN